MERTAHANRIKLVIFDLDGTTADTLDGICEALNRTMTSCGYPTHTSEEVRRFVNFGVRQFIEEALPADRRADAAEVERVMALYNAEYARTYTLSHPYEGMIPLLERLSERTLVAMNSNKQDEFVKALADQLFPAGLLLAAEGFRTDRPGKPDPSMALAIMEQAARALGEPVAPAECVYVGDSDIDYLTARNAGMIPVSVSWGYRTHEFLAALGDQPVARTADELWEVLMNAGVSPLHPDFLGVSPQTPPKTF